MLELPPNRKLARHERHGVDLVDGDAGAEVGVSWEEVVDLCTEAVGSGRRRRVFGGRRAWEVCCGEPGAEGEGWRGHYRVMERENNGDRKQA
jgi:hypothetical protein